MTARRVLVVGAGLVFVSLVIVQIRKNEPPPASSTANRLPRSQPATSQAASTAAGKASVFPSAPPPALLEGQPAMEPPALADLSFTDRPPLADAIGAPGTKPEAEPKLVLELLNSYRRILKNYPAGENNRQLMNALRGANREKLPFVPQDHPRLNAEGELVDAWGTPFFFHQLSRSTIEVRSAGADRLLFTDDDIVAGKTASQSKEPTILETRVSGN